MNPLIIGIDPGITLAYAILDFNGNLLKLNSSKQHTLSSLTSEFISIGKPSIISTDVSPPSHFVTTLSKKLGTKLIYPKETIKINEKRQLTSNYKVKNAHERDALFSVLNAYKQIIPLFNKIDSYLKKHNKQYLSLKVKEISIKENKSFSQIIKELEPKKIKKAIKKKRNKSSISIKEKEKDILLEKIKRLNEENKILNNKLFSLSKLFNNKLQNQLRKNINIHKNKIDFLIKENKKLKDEKNNHLKHLSLTTKYFFLDKNQKNSSLIFIEDPDKESFKADKVIYKIKPKKTHDAILINLKDLNYIEEENYFLINKESYNEILQNKKIFYEIIKNYKKSR